MNVASTEMTLEEKYVLLQCNLFCGDEASFNAVNFLL
jgi:hypothetical protein